MTAITGLRDDPVILLGMHHSGTSIFSRILHTNGVYMDATTRNFESKIFSRDLNGELIMGGRERWARSPIMSVDEVMAKLDSARDPLERQGRKKLLRNGYDGVSPWGWKDPRTCVTLPLFLALFPRARLLHIVRNPDDVAESLATRNTKQHPQDESARDFWRDLQAQYVGRAREYGMRHGDYFEFAYEDFCTRPVEVTESVFERLQVPFTSEIADFLRANIYTHRIGVGGKASPE